MLHVAHTLVYIPVTCLFIANFFFAVCQHRTNYKQSLKELHNELAIRMLFISELNDASELTKSDKRRHETFIFEVLTTTQDCGNKCFGSLPLHENRFMLIK